MSVRLRLTRMGRKKRPYYRIVAIDSRKKREGAFIERIGYYHPLNDPPAVKIDGEKALKWLHVGAQPSETVRSLLRREGVWLRFLLEKRKLPESQINEMMLEWMKEHSPKEAAAKSIAIEKALKTPVEPVTPVEEITSAPVVVAEVSETPSPEEVAEVTETPSPVEVAEVTETPSPEEVAEVIETPSPVEVAEVTETPSPVEVGEVTETPSPEKPKDVSVETEKPEKEKAD